MGSGIGSCVIGLYANCRSLPTVHALRVSLESCCKGVHSGTKEDFPPIGRARVGSRNVNWVCNGYPVR